MTPLEFEKIVIKLLYTNVTVRDKIFPFLDTKIFDGKDNVDILKLYNSFHEKYQKFPTLIDTSTQIENPDLSKAFTDIAQYDMTGFTEEFLLNQVEDFFRKKLIHKANMDISYNLVENNVEECGKGIETLQNAMAFSFDTRIGIDVLEDEELIYQSFTDNESYVPTYLPYLDEILEGGLYEGTLNLFLAESNMGKSIVKGAIAVNCFTHNKKVLLISLEMKEKKYIKRLLANLLDIAMRDFKTISKEEFSKKYNEAKKYIKSKFILKEYPTKTISVNNIRTILNDLKLKKNFVPDIIVLDYMELLKATHLSKTANSDTEYQRIAEEVRGLAGEYNIPILTSFQTNRSGYDSADLDMTDIGLSIGVVKTADTMIGIMQPEEMKNANPPKFIFKVIKNRDGVKGLKVVVDINYSKMRIVENDDASRTQRDANPANRLQQANEVVQGILQNDKLSKISNNIVWN